LLAFAAERRAAARAQRRPPLSVDISRPPRLQQQTRRTPQLQHKMEQQTNGQTNTALLHRQGRRAHSMGTV